ncbi:glycosyltransferase family 2 protein [Cyanobium sp. Morenito 9A2]|nr:glycosyltransferase family 2 protein [Cyanobium sp. Morenito 9A2]
MNRRDHLLHSSAQLALWSHHQEHLIVDWSSNEPLRREDLPADPRLRLVRVEGESIWNLCRAYNFAISLARGPWILKLDADCWPTAAFEPTLVLPDGSGSSGPGEGAYALGSGPDGRKGQFLIALTLFTAVGGFNEYLVGYGFDDKDLKIRLGVFSRREPLAIPPPWLEVIAHTDAERAELWSGEQRSLIGQSLGTARMRASRLSNRLLVAYHPWSSHSIASQYNQQPDGSWRVKPDSIPSPSPEVAEEIGHVRRMMFWGCFLAIPETFLAVMPFKLFPPARQGRWQVRWWHRLYWYTGRQLLAIPVCLLASTRGLLMELKQLFRRA